MAERSVDATRREIDLLLVEPEPLVSLTEGYADVAVGGRDRRPGLLVQEGGRREGGGDGRRADAGTGGDGRII